MHACTSKHMKIKTEIWAFSALNFKSNLKAFKKSTFVDFFCGLFKENSIEAKGTHYLHNALLFEIENTYALFLLPQNRIAHTS